MQLNFLKMIKKVFCILFIFCFASCLTNQNTRTYIYNNNKILGNRIDALKTTKDIVEFAKSIYPKFAKNGSGNMKIKTTDSIAEDLYCNGFFKAWNVKNWEKIDINNDGNTDLIFQAYWLNEYSPYAIVYNGKNNFKLFSFSTNAYNVCELIKPIKIEDRNELMIYHSKSFANNELRNIPRITIVDTLTYKFGSFIEINHNKEIKYDVESIEIKTSPCFGGCPSYDLKINKKGIAEYNGKSFTDYKGKSVKKIPQKKFKKIVRLLEYIRINDLDNEYDVDWTDSQTSYLKILFSDGSVKEVRDYGMQGSFGLTTVYANLLTIVNETNWK